jgi:hypothetical protein
MARVEPEPEGSLATETERTELGSTETGGLDTGETAGMGSAVTRELARSPTPSLRSPSPSPPPPRRLPAIEVYTVSTLDMPGMLAPEEER